MSGRVLFVDIRVMRISAHFCRLAWLVFPRRISLRLFPGSVFLFPYLRYYCLLCWWVFGVIIHGCLASGVDVVRAAFLDPHCVLFWRFCILMWPHSCCIAFWMSCGGYCLGRRLRCLFCLLIVCGVFVVLSCFGYCSSLYDPSVRVLSPNCLVGDFVFVVHMEVVVRVCVVRFPACRFLLTVGACFCSLLFFFPMFSALFRHAAATVEVCPDCKLRLTCCSGVGRCVCWVLFVGGVDFLFLFSPGYLGVHFSACISFCDC